MQLLPVSSVCTGAQGQAAASLEGYTRADVPSGSIALLGATCCPPLVPYPKFKAQLDPPALILPKQKAMQTPLLAAYNLLLFNLLFRPHSHVFGRWQTLNLLLVLLATGLVQWGDGVQPLSQGGWRSRNLRRWKNTISDSSLKDEASFSSQTTVLHMRSMLRQPRGLCWETYSVRCSCPSGKHHRKRQGFLQLPVTKPFSVL